MMKRAAIMMLLVVCWTITISRHNTHALPRLISQAPAGADTATFTNDGFTLSITARCESAERPCPFRAEIHAAPSLFELIKHVEYTFFPDRPTSPSPVTDASTSFRLDAKQIAGENVYAEVTLRGGGGAPARIVRLEGTVPFAREVKPPLPSGLRFEIHYQPWYLEGGALVEYLFKIQLLGEPAALKRVKSVEYRLPADESKRPRITHRVESEYFLEGSMPNKEGVVIIAAIRWKSGESTTHTIPLRPRL